jgi:hypothetical protein
VSASPEKEFTLCTGKMHCLAIPSSSAGAIKPSFVQCSRKPCPAFIQGDRAAPRHRCHAVDPRKANSPVTGDIEDEEFEGLTPEEDWVVPGPNTGSLSQNTELGKAVNAACDELEHLGGLESEMLQQADDVLRKFGFKPVVMQPARRAQEGSDGEGDKQK